jgi:hypothetical protein
MCGQPRTGADIINKFNLKKSQSGGLGHKIRGQKNVNHGPDKYRFRCSCNKSVGAIRANTFLEDTRISEQQVLQLVIHWAIMTTQVVQAKMFQADVKTIRHLQQKLRAVATKFLSKQDIVLGGPGKIVEIDESLRSSEA